MEFVRKEHFWKYLSHAVIFKHNLKLIWCWMCTLFPGIVDHHNINLGLCYSYRGALLVTAGFLLFLLRNVSFQPEKSCNNLWSDYPSKPI